MSAAAKRHKDRVASLGCLICRRPYGTYVPAQLLHIAEGSGKRSDFAVAPLCGPEYEDHHDGRQTGGAGFHRMGKQFLILYRVPGETEWGLLQWVFEDMEEYGER